MIKLQDLTNNETIQIWVEDMLNNEIHEAQGTIANEHLWGLGSETPEDEMMHSDNIETLREYIEVLETLKKEILA